VDILAWYGYGCGYSQGGNRLYCNIRGFFWNNL